MVFRFKFCNAKHSVWKIAKMLPELLKNEILIYILIERNILHPISRMLTVCYGLWVILAYETFFYLFF